MLPSLQFSDPSCAYLGAPACVSVLACGLEGRESWPCVIYIESLQSPPFFTPVPYLSFINYTLLIALLFIGGLGEKEASESLPMEATSVSKLPREMDHLSYSQI